MIQEPLKGFLGPLKYFHFYFDMGHETCESRFVGETKGARNEPGDSTMLSIKKALVNVACWLLYVCNLRILVSHTYTRTLNTFVVTIVHRAGKGYIGGSCLQFGRCVKGHDVRNAHAVNRGFFIGFNTLAYPNDYNYTTKRYGSRFGFNDIVHLPNGKYSFPLAAKGYSVGE